MFLKNKNINFKIRRSKITDYAALMVVPIGGRYVLCGSGHGAVRWCAVCDCGIFLIILTRFFVPFYCFGNSKIVQGIKIFELF